MNRSMQTIFEPPYIAGLLYMATVARVVVTRVRRDADGEAKMQSSRMKTTWMVALCVATMASGCSSTMDRAADEDSGSPATTPSESADGVDQWLLALEQGSSPASPGTRRYVLLDLDTGRTTQVPMPPEADVDTDAEDVLEVSADNQLALRDRTLSKDERKSAMLNLYPLREGAERLSLDLRAITKDMTLSPAAAAFDPVKPEILHIATEDGAIWDIDVAAKSGTRRSAQLATEDGVVAFAPATGVPFIKTTDGNAPFEGWPQPGGEILTDEDSYPELPDGRGIVFKTQAGQLWAFQLQGSAFRTYKSIDGATWNQVDVSPTPPIPTGEGMHLDWARPPKDL